MYRDLSLEQSRQVIDAEQVFSAYQDVSRELADRFDGTMNWRKVKAKDYLYRVRRASAHSLGARSPETETAHAAFHAGKTRLQASLATLTGRINAMAPVNRALQLGRLPVVSGRILRGLAEHGLLGTSLFVVGTNAIYAYERLCGVQVEGGYMATADVDLLFDSRRRLKFASAELSERGLVGLLKRVDKSFELAGHRSFTAVNDAGFMVDLIKPMPKNPFVSKDPDRLSSVSGDLQAIEIEGLASLVNVGKLRQTVIDERGFPVDMVCPDPRAFALHKFWLSQREDREPAKRRRDAAQAALIAELIIRRLPAYRFDDDAALSAVPKAIRQMRETLVALVPPVALSGTPEW